MGMDLIGRDWELSCSARFWNDCLELAGAFGWVPAGTTASNYEHSKTRDAWKGGYTTNDYQIVIDEDAREFALALQRAISATMMETPLSLRQGTAVAAFKSEIEFAPWSGRSIAIIRVKEIARLAKLAGTSGFEIW